MNVNPWPCPCCMSDLLEASDLLIYKQRWIINEWPNTFRPAYSFCNLRQHLLVNNATHYDRLNPLNFDPRLNMVISVDTISLESCLSSSFPFMLFEKDFVYVVWMLNGRIDWPGAWHSHLSKSVFWPLHQPVCECMTMRSWTHFICTVKFLLLFYNVDLWRGGEVPRLIYTH